MGDEGESVEEEATTIAEEAELMGGDEAPAPNDPDMYIPIYAMTGIYACIFVVVPILCRGPHKGIIRASVMIGAVAMYVFWLVVYVAQMNPMVGPKLQNTTLAWISHTWGSKAPDYPKNYNGTTSTTTTRRRKG